MHSEVSCLTNLIVCHSTECGDGDCTVCSDGGASSCTECDPGYGVSAGTCSKSSPQHAVYMSYVQAHVVSHLHDIMFT